MARAAFQAVHSKSPEVVLLFMGAREFCITYIKQFDFTLSDCLTRYHLRCYNLSHAGYKNYQTKYRLG